MTDNKLKEALEAFESKNPICAAVDYEHKYGSSPVHVMAQAARKYEKLEPLLQEFINADIHAAAGENCSVGMVIQKQIAAIMAEGGGE